MPVDWMPVELIPCNMPTEALHAALLTHQLVDTMVRNETGRRLHKRWLNTRVRATQNTMSNITSNIRETRNTMLGTRWLSSNNARWECWKT